MQKGQSLSHAGSEMEAREDFDVSNNVSAALKWLQNDLAVYGANLVLIQAARASHRTAGKTICCQRIRPLARDELITGWCDSVPPLAPWTAPRQRGAFNCFQVCVLAQYNTTSWTQAQLEHGNTFIGQ